MYNALSLCLRVCAFRSTSIFEVLREAQYFYGFPLNISLQISCLYVSVSVRIWGLLIFQGSDVQGRTQDFGEGGGFV